MINHKFVPSAFRAILFLCLIQKNKGEASDMALSSCGIHTFKKHAIAFLYILIKHGHG